MTIEHSSLTGAQIHQSKGVSAASAATYNLALSGANNWDTLYYDEAVTASSSASIEFNDLAQFCTICLSFDDLLLSTSTAAVRMRFSADNGSNYNSSSIYYTVYNQDGTSLYESDNTYLYLNPTSQAAYLTGEVYITNFNKALVSTMRGMAHNNTSANLGGTPAGRSVVGAVNSATAWNCLEIYPSTGTFTSGVVNLQGIRG